MVAVKLSKRQIRDIVQWDIKTWAKALDFWQSRLRVAGGMRSLELGGNKGGLSLWLALNGSTVVCSDLENTATLAEELHQKHHVSTRIKYLDLDATEIPFHEEFDAVAFKSIIGGIARNGNREKGKQVFEEIYKALKPGGTLYFAENMAASPLHAFVRKRFVSWGDSWTYWKKEDLHYFLSDFESVEVHTTGFAAAFGRSEAQRKFLATLDALLFNYILPSGWKYVAYGKAVKPQRP